MGRSVGGKTKMGSEEEEDDDDDKEDWERGTGR